MAIAIAIAALLVLIGMWKAITAVTSVYAQKADRWAKLQEVDLAEDNAKVKEVIDDKVAEGIIFLSSQALNKHLDNVIKGKK